MDQIHPMKLRLSQFFKWNPIEITGVVSGEDEVCWLYVDTTDNLQFLHIAVLKFVMPDFPEKMAALAEDVSVFSGARDINLDEEAGREYEFFLWIVPDRGNFSLLASDFQQHFRNWMNPPKRSFREEVIHRLTHPVDSVRLALIIIIAWLNKEYIQRSYDRVMHVEAGFTGHVSMMNDSVAKIHGLKPLNAFEQWLIGQDTIDYIRARNRYAFEMSCMATMGEHPDDWC